MSLIKSFKNTLYSCVNQTLVKIICGHCELCSSLACLQTGAVFFSIPSVALVLQQASSDADPVLFASSDTEDYEVLFTQKRYCLVQSVSYHYGIERLHQSVLLHHLQL